jgi:hypothetical protein
VSASKLCAGRSAHWNGGPSPSPFGWGRSYLRCRRDTCQALPATRSPESKPALHRAAGAFVAPDQHHRRRLLRLRLKIHHFCGALSHGRLSAIRLIRSQDPGTRNAMNHYQRQFMQYLRGGDWVKVATLPHSPSVKVKLVGLGWIERRGSRLRDLLSHHRKRSRL